MTPMLATRHRTSALALALALAAPATAPALAQQAAIPDHPDKLSFQPIAYEPPRAADSRVVLKNGMVVFIAEDNTCPS